MSDSPEGHLSGISRRRFFGAAAGGAAFSLLGATAGTPRAPSHADLLRDYVGRLCYNENPLGPSPLAMAAISDAIPMGHRYPDWYADSLRGDLGSIHGLSSSNFVAGCGGTEVLRLAAFAFADPDGNVVCPYPSYGQFAGDAGFLGAEVRQVALDANHRIDLNAMLAQVDGATSAVCITNPNNPTATVLSAAEILSFVNALPAQVTVVIDEAYHEFVHDAGYESAMELVRQDKSVVVIRTFSKAHGFAGIRVGFAAAKTSLISSMNAWHIYATVSRLALDGARAALGDVDHINNTVALADSAKDYCFMMFDAMGLDYIPSETNFFMVDVGQSASQVRSELSARGILVRTGWGMPNHLRVSCGTMAEMEDFINALMEILGILHSGGSVDPKITAIYGSFPNPAREATEIHYSIASGGHARLVIYDAQGRLVRTLVDQPQTARFHEVRWNARDDAGHRCAAGSYFYRLTLGDTVETRRLILVD